MYRATRSPEPSSKGREPGFGVRLGSVAYAQTGYNASTSPREPTCRDGVPRRSRPWRRHWTKDRTNLRMEDAQRSSKRGPTITLDQVVLHPQVEPGQYTSTQLAGVAAELGPVQSVGRTGVCWDNSCAESFWSTLKTEYYDRHHRPTKAEARQAVGSWIEDRYNRRRRHSAIAMLSSVDFKQRLTVQDPAV
jgi:putative transposase